jgi:hypothetical protein
MDAHLTGRLPQARRGQLNATTQDRPGLPRATNATTQDRPGFGGRGSPLVQQRRCVFANG